MIHFQWSKQFGAYCNRIELVTRPEMNQLHLSRLVFLFGHVAICQLNYLDVSIFNELKRRNHLRDLKKEKAQMAQKQKQRKSKSRKSLGSRSVNMSASASFLAGEGATPARSSKGSTGLATMAVLLCLLFVKESLIDWRESQSSPTLYELFLG